MGLRDRRPRGGPLYMVGPAGGSFALDVPPGDPYLAGLAQMWERDLALQGYRRCSYLRYLAQTFRFNLPRELPSP